MGIISGLFSMFGWGVADFLAAKASRKIGYILTLFWMQTIGLLVAIIYFLAKFQSFNMGGIIKFLPTFIIIGFLQIVGYLAFYRGLEKGQVSLVSPIGASWAIITVILSVIFFKEPLLKNQIVSIILIILGIILVSTNFQEPLKIRRLKTFSGISGTKEGLIAMFGWGISLFLIVPAVKTLGWFLPIFLFRVFMILFLGSFIFFSKRSFKISPRLPLLVILVPIGFLDIGAFFVYSFGVSRAYSSIVAPIAAAFPLITILLAKIFLKEKIVLNQIFGIAAILCGLILISIT